MPHQAEQSKRNFCLSAPRKVHCWKRSRARGEIFGILCVISQQQKKLSTARQKVWLKCLNIFHSGSMRCSGLILAYFSKRSWYEMTFMLEEKGTAFYDAWEEKDKKIKRKFNLDYPKNKRSRGTGNIFGALFQWRKKKGERLMLYNVSHYEIQSPTRLHDYPWALNLQMNT